MPKWRGIAVKRSWTLAERLDFYSIPEPNSGCTLWFGPADRHGYGKSKYKHKGFLAHRAAWELRHGPTNGLDVLHRCDNPACINPDHLFLGTQADNSRDMHRKGRNPKGEQQGNAVLTNVDVHAIRDAKGTHREIAAQFSVAHGTVGRIKRRTGWKHLPEGRAAIEALQPRREG